MYASSIGIHYSGAETSNSRLKALSVYRANGSGQSKKIITPDAYKGNHGFPSQPQGRHGSRFPDLQDVQG